MSSGSHVSRRTTQFSYLGTKSVGAGSNAPSRISISPDPGATLNIVDPQTGQKCRASLVAVQLAVLPTMVTSLARQTGMTANAAHPSQRQTVQWQMATLTGSPRVLMRLAPQLQWADRTILIGDATPRHKPVQRQWIATRFFVFGRGEVGLIASGNAHRWSSPAQICTGGTRAFGSHLRNSSKARRRSEHPFRTSQGWLPRELPLVTTAAATNVWLAEHYIAQHHAAFAVTA
jgi:hypothetical protein